MLPTSLASRILMATVFVMACSQAAHSATYYVSQSGKDTGNGTSAGAAFRTIGRAAQSLKPGDSVVIGPGTYAEAAVFADLQGTAAKPISITGDETGKQAGAAAGA